MFPPPFCPRPPAYTTGSVMVIVRGAVVRVPELFATSVSTFTTCPTVKGPSALPLASSGSLCAKSASTPTTCHFTSLRVVCHRRSYGAAASRRGASGVRTPST